MVVVLLVSDLYVSELFLGLIVFVSGMFVLSVMLFGFMLM